LSPLFPPQTGGAAVFLDLLLKKVLDNENTSNIKRRILLTSHVPGMPLIYKEHSALIIRLLISPKEIEKRKIKGLGMINILLSFLTTFCLIIIFRIDILHSLAKYSLRGGIKAGRLLNKRIVIDARDLGGPYLKEKVDFFVCASERIFELANKVRQNREEEIKYIPVPSKIPEKVLPVNINTLIKKEGELKGYILFVGDIAPRKGIEELIEGFKIFNKSNKNIGLAFVGKNLLERGITDSKNKIFYLGPKTHQTTLGLMKNAAIIVLPSKEEGLPRVALEAFALKKPVILPPRVEEFERNCPQFILKKITPKFIAKKLEIVFKTRPKCNYPLQKHAPQRIFNQYVKIYNKLRQ